MGGKTVPKTTETVKLFEKGKLAVDYANGNSLLPQIHVDKGVLVELCASWTEALVVCLLGKKLGYRTMKTRSAYL